ncbi:MAG TPA: hypothetical protein VER12_01730 [Polyangiaceae bacterium]|nr:hypothetical protein [Polyangiaceae bacterium]HYQ27714.1 hypothetical protein [Polyangiaceae bacterium]
MGIIKFDIRHGNGQRETAVVEGQRALIGSASHCDVRLAMDEAAYEQILIEVVGCTLRAQARAELPLATIDGAEFVASALSPESVLGVGNTRLYVSFVPDALDGPQISQQQQAKRPWLGLALIPLLGALLWLVFGDGETKIASAPTQVQALFSDAPTSCPQQDGSRALAFAEEQTELAEGKQERMPFAIEDGVVAVGLYRLAASCFLVGGDSARARETEQAAALLKQELTDEYRARRLRLSHLLTVEDYALALQDVTVLRALTGEKKGRYFEWLTQVAEQLKVKGIQ